MTWYLVQGEMPVAEVRRFASRLMECSATEAKQPLSMLPNGRVVEIVHGADWTDSARFTITRLTPFERTWRMAWRVWNTWIKLDGKLRRTCGLTLRRVLTDLPAAYRVATYFRGMSYKLWCETVDTLSDLDRQRIDAQMATWTAGPRFRVLFALGSGEAQHEAAATLNDQLYKKWQVIREGASLAPNDWLLLLRPNDRLSVHALYWFACESMTHPDAMMIYADDDEIEAGQRCRPRFKPDWSLTHLKATNYIGRAVAMNARAIADAGGLKTENLADNPWELLLRIGELAGNRVRHIPAILLHRDAETEGRGPGALQRVHFHLPLRPPLVSIVVPTRDAADLLRKCIESILNLTTYPRFEIVVVDNDSRDATALAYLAQIARLSRVRVLTYAQPFNYSAINNFAAEHVEGEVLCLLNNDTEVISPDWLEEMVGHLLQDGIGIVGAKLYYPNGRVQHGGDTVGPGGCANHLHQFIAGDDPGYCNRANVAQELSAVTAACMVTWRSLYRQLRGLNERWLPVSFNDVDYCLRVRKSGHKVVWTPHAELYHHESVSRGKNKGWRQEFRAWREVRFMRWKWHEEMKSDPFYNPNFSYFRPDFVLGPAPNVRRPWLVRE